MSREPLVSIIIPTYNRAKFLPRAVNSVLNQTFKDFELIIVDDASTDNTKDIIQGFKDPHIRYIKHNDNRGIAGARNTGIKTSKGEYIAFLDDDDEWLPEKLTLQVRKFEKCPDRVGLIYCNYTSIDVTTGTKRDKNLVPCMNNILYKQLLSGNIIGSGTYLIKKECFDKVGLFDEEVLGKEDWDMWIRIARYYHFDYLLETLVIHYDHPSQMTSNLNKRYIALEKIIKKHENNMRNFPKIYSRHLNILGKLHLLYRKRKKCIYCLLKSIRYNPFKKSSYLYLLLSLLPQFLTKSVIRKRIFEPFKHKTIL